AGSLFRTAGGARLPPWRAAAGVGAYDPLAGGWNVRRHRRPAPEGVAAAEPALRRDGLRGAGQYWDCRTDDARLVLETALAAGREGATIVSYADVTDFVKEDGRIVGVPLRDRLSPAETTVQALVVVNPA